jgi:hypothetical protein
MIAAMRQRSFLTFLLLTLAISPVMADVPSLLKIFRRTAAVEADQSKTYELNETDGPWLILASWQPSKQQAEQLALEIRRELNLQAFIYHENFDFTGSIRNKEGISRKMRYANPHQYEAYAVLVGEYDTTNHPGIKRDLELIRAANLPVFQNLSQNPKATDELSPIERVKELTNEILRMRKDKQPRPMGNAFVTRNPKLPQDYFKPPEVDSFVHQLNDGVPHSLLKCNGKYTVVVKTFEGQATIVDGKHDKKFKPSGDRLAKNSEKANRMTEALRTQGVEAYQFHDRFRSLVTVGSFEELGRELPDGKFEYAPEIRRLMKKYRALNVRPELARQVPQGNRGPQGVAANSAAMIPFDVEPKPIIVPKISKRSLYGAAFGMR